MKWLLIIILIILYVILLAGAFYASWWFTMRGHAYSEEVWKNFGVAATVGGTAVSALMAVTFSIVNAFMQASAAAGLKVLEVGIVAHGDLYESAAYYYRLLAPLATGDFDPIEIEKAELKMKAAEARTVYVGNKYEEQWQSLWQKCRTLKETVNAGAPDKPRRIGLWTQHSKLLAQDLSKMKKIVRKRFRV